MFAPVVRSSNLFLQIGTALPLSRMLWTNLVSLIASWCALLPIHPLFNLVVRRLIMDSPGPTSSRSPTTSVKNDTIKIYFSIYCLLLGTEFIFPKFNSMICKSTVSHWASRHQYTTRILVRLLILAQRCSSFRWKRSMRCTPRSTRCAIRFLSKASAVTKLYLTTEKKEKREEKKKRNEKRREGKGRGEGTEGKGCKENRREGKRSEGKKRKKREKAREDDQRREYSHRGRKHLARKEREKRRKERKEGEGEKKEKKQSREDSS